MKRRIILFMMVFLSIALLLSISGCAEVKESPTVTVAVTISIDYGPAQGEERTNESHELEMPAGSNLWEALNEVADVKATYYKEYDDYFVDAINGVENNITASGCYWMWYHINGGEELGTTGAKRNKLQQGDHVLWRYEIPK